jgi:hypothetical protein
MQLGYNFTLARAGATIVPRLDPLDASAGVAQLVEQRIRNAKVEGSTPSTGTIRTTISAGLRHPGNGPRRQNRGSVPRRFGAATL